MGICEGGSFGAVRYPELFVYVTAPYRTGVDKLSQNHSWSGLSALLIAVVSILGLRPRLV
jgi:hypothetical protein